MNLKIERLVAGIYDRGYEVYENFFEENDIDAFLNSLEKKELLLKNAGIGKDRSYTEVKEIRSDKILWIEKGTDEKLDLLFFNRIEEILSGINRRCYLGLNDYEFHFAKYEPGTFYKRHKDVFKNDDARKISVIIYLNKNWKEGDGGELKIYLEDKEITVMPKAGTLVMFESALEHEVMLSNTNRYSITGWLKRSVMIL